MYSPSESPAAAATGSSPFPNPSRPFTPARHATDATKIAGCDTSVRFSTPSGPSKHSVESLPSPAVDADPAQTSAKTPSARSNTPRASGEASNHALAIPTACAPWPGQSMMIGSMGEW